MDSLKADIGRDKVVKIINSVIEKVEAAEDVSRENIYLELKALHDLIEVTRKEISASRASDISGTHIPDATDELDAVVEATEVATGTIMDSCEALTAYADQLDSSHKDYVLSQVTKILEACSFQDITGQRITKVVRSIKQIDEKISALMNVLEDKIPGLPNSPFVDAREGDAKLLNGPQMADKAITQSDIDKLLEDLF
ncbi:MAG: protein phosphatase CheZ [Alphaproteobacteria bacterium]|nr:protein phosphatase CheZ [Alphaproteobacteria bacterium]